MPGLDKVEQIELDTPFGKPSDPYYRGRIGAVDVVFLARHGRGHRILPSEINYRANIFGMKQLGAEYLVSVSTAGSMKEEIHPGDLVVPDQFYDRTIKRPATFFGGGIVVHVSLADPVCAALGAELTAAGRATGSTIHAGGTYLCIEGPQFSTRAESVTDYDCWHQSVAAVDIGEILRVMRANVDRAQKAIANLAERIGKLERKCACGSALAGTIITDPAVIPAQLKQDLHPLIGKYLN
jgi:5'-methylthioadenosine phosphorylase